MRFSIRFVVGALALASLSTISMAGGLGVGSAAPTISVAKWIKGKPVNLKDGGIHVVEFWATWCGPCKQSIPHLTELAKKFKGKVDFTGVSVWEDPKAQDNSYIQKVSSFVNEWGDKMDYNVAADGFEGTMAKTWMQAAGQNGIPAAFVVGKEGKILWIGHPMAGLEETLDQVVAGTFDAQKAADEMKAREAAQAKAQEVLQPYFQAIGKKDFRGAVKALDQAMSEAPDLKPQLSMEKFTCMLKYDEAGAQTFALELAGGVFKTNGQMVNSLAWAIVDEEGGVKKPNLSLAVKLAQQAVDLMGGNDPFSLDTLALAQFRNGQVDAAIKSSTKAVSAAKATSGFDAATMKEITARLAKFKAKKGK